MKDLMLEVERFREWARINPRAGIYGEWECDYDSWPALWEAVLEFVASKDFRSWSNAELRAILYAIARDNEMQHLARTIRENHPEVILALAQAASEIGERDDRWQLAVESGFVGGDEAERLLLVFVQDEHEYVRRRALGSLLRLGSPAVEELALAAWHRPDDSQEWSRMNALDCLRKLCSSHLEVLLADAEHDTRPLLREFAQKMRRGEVLE